MENFIKLKRVSPVEKIEPIKNGRPQMQMSKKRNSKNNNSNTFNEMLKLEDERHKKNKDDELKKITVNLKEQKEFMENRKIGKIQRLKDKLENIETQQAVCQINRKKKITEYEKNFKTEER